MINSPSRGLKYSALRIPAAFLVFGALLLALGAIPAQAAFDFDEGNAAIEVVIPAAVPAIFAAVSPGDAPLVLRFTTMLTNAWFDATAPYHPTAVGVYSRIDRRPEEEWKNSNSNIAILFASYRTLNSLFPSFAKNWRAMMESVGLDPDYLDEDSANPAGIGNLAANAMLMVRENDGMNQLGNEGGRAYNMQPYADYTGYAPVNTAYKLKAPSRWQPHILVSPYGISRVQQYITPQYALVIPYSYNDPSVFSVAPPLKSQWRGSPNARGLRMSRGSANADYIAQAVEVIEASANLTDEEKMTAELFDDKIRSLGFASIFAARGLSAIEFVHYDFLVNAAAFDTGIVMWQEKTRYDAVRPFSTIRFLFGESPITAWGGPGKGTVNDLPANQWRSYLPVADHPEYPSGSTGVCEAHAQASRLFFGDDQLGWSVPAPAGSSVIEPGVTPSRDINLFFDSWTDFAEDCGNSRLWGGVHFRDAIDNMRHLGREIGTQAYVFVKAHIDGSIAK
ncbi:MAG TPA: vanadium-dependent haloperoxidase [Desulfobacterales bacterium]|nr:vanadium-dependent haloperoxidase [Desulfobacterales bacterium]